MLFITFLTKQKDNILQHIHRQITKREGFSASTLQTHKYLQ